MTTYIIRSSVNAKLILCTTGEFKPESMVGPGGYCAKAYRTLVGAQRKAVETGGYTVPYSAPLSRRTPRGAAMRSHLRDTRAAGERTGES